MLLTVDLERLDVQPGETLLDAGCGEGRHCFGALERGARVVGLDLDLDSLRPAAGGLRNRGRELGKLGGMTQGNTFHLPFRDETFDKVICSEVMEHVHDFTGVARELARVTKRGGRLAITIPTATSEHLYLRVGDDYFESRAVTSGSSSRVSSHSVWGARASPPAASVSPTRSTRRTGCSARSRSCHARTRAAWSGPIACS